MVTLGNLRLLYGDVVETATIVRSLLAPVATQLSGHPSDLHRRCVLGYGLACFRKPGEAAHDPSLAKLGAFDADDVHADLAPFGAIEAVAVCAPMFYAAPAVVFKDECKRRDRAPSAGGDVDGDVQRGPAARQGAPAPLHATGDDQSRY